MHIFLNLSNKKCLVVGGGPVAERKVQALLAYGARVRVVSPALTGRLSELAAAGIIDYRRGSYHVDDLAGVFLVIGATGREEVNRQVAADCEERGLLINVVDDPERGNFFVPAHVKRGSLSIAVSTGGKSPLLAGKIRAELEPVYGPQYAEFLDFLGGLRLKLMREVADPVKKREVMDRMLDDEVLTLLKSGQLERAKERVLNAYHSGGG